MSKGIHSSKTGTYIYSVEPSENLVYVLPTCQINPLDIILLVRVPDLGIPTPVSLTLNSTAPGTTDISTVMAPSNVSVSASVSGTKLGRKRYDRRTLEGVSNQVEYDFLPETVQD